MGEESDALEMEAWGHEGEMDFGDEDCELDSEDEEEEA